MVGKKRKSPAIPPQDKLGVCKKSRKMSLPAKLRSIIPMDQLPMEVLEKLVTYLDVVSTPISLKVLIAWKVETSLKVKVL